MPNFQITLVNTALLQRLHRDGDWDTHVFKQMTNYIKCKERKVLETITDDTAMYEYLGCTDEKCQNQTLDNAQRDICDNNTISFGTYLIKNDSIRSYIVMKQFINSFYSPFHILLLKSVYQQLVTSRFDLGSSSVENCDDTSNTNNFVDYWMIEETGANNTALSNSNVSQTFLRINYTAKCSIVSMMQVFRNHLFTFSDLSSNWTFTVCAEGLCENLESDFETIFSYFIVISDFIQLYLLQNFTGWYKSLAANQIYHTLSQRSLALGYTEEDFTCDELFSKPWKGILTSHSSIEEVFFTSPKTSVSTCLDQGNTDNNMIVRGKAIVPSYRVCRCESFGVWCTNKYD